MGLKKLLAVNFDHFLEFFFIEEFYDMAEAIMVRLCSLEV